MDHFLASVERIATISSIYELVALKAMVVTLTSRVGRFTLSMEAPP